MKVFLVLGSWFLVVHDVGIEFVDLRIAEFTRLQSLGDLFDQVPIDGFIADLAEVVRAVQSVLNFHRPLSAIDVEIDC